MATSKNRFNWGSKKVYYGRGLKVDKINIQSKYVEIY